MVFTVALLDMTDSSQNIKSRAKMSFPVADPRDTAIRVSIDALIGIFQRECAVLPPFKSTAAIPDEAVATAIFRSFRSAASKALANPLYAELNPK